MKYTVSEFAAKIRRLYPGDYEDLPDDKLVELWLRKHPNDRGKVDFTEEPEIKSKSRAAGIQETIVYQRSNWVRQLLFGLALLFLFFISYLKNPTSDDFTKQLEFKYNEKFKNELKQDGLVEGIFGMFSTALDHYLNSNYKRSDLLFFSIYHREVENTTKVIAIGFWNNFYFLEEPFPANSNNMNSGYLDKTGDQKSQPSIPSGYSPVINNLMNKYNVSPSKDAYGNDILRIDNYPEGGIILYLDSPTGGRVQSINNPQRTGTWSENNLKEK